MIKKYIWVTFQKEGIHWYPDAPKEVSFLRAAHRHIFHFRVKLEVSHNEREIEFILFKQNLEYRQPIINGTTSCETIAEEVLGYVKTKYPSREIFVEVSEDNENGCEVHYTPGTYRDSIA